METQNNNTKIENILRIPVDFKVLSSNHKDIYKKRTEKRQTNFIKKIQFIKPFLREDEKVLLVSTGCSPMSLMEQLLTGWIIFYLKQAYFIFTNRRIFHVPAKSYKYRNSIAQILYSDCESIKQSGGTLKVKYKSGKKENFYHIAGREKKKIKMLMQKTSLTGQPGQIPQRTHLCPRCTGLLIKDKFTCPTCSLAFKTKKEALKTSMIWPGGGYFYTRHPLLGTIDALTEIILTFALISSLIDFFYNEQASLDFTIFLAILLFIEKIITIFHSNHFIKEFIPENKNITPYIKSPS